MGKNLNLSLSAFINKMKKKTKKKNEGFGLPTGVIPSPSRKCKEKQNR